MTSVAAGRAMIITLKLLLLSVNWRYIKQSLHSDRSVHLHRVHKVAPKNSRRSFCGLDCWKRAKNTFKTTNFSDGRHIVSTSSMLYSVHVIGCVCFARSIHGDDQWTEWMNECPIYKPLYMYIPGGSKKVLLDKMQFLDNQQRFLPKFQDL